MIQIDRDHKITQLSNEVYSQVSDIIKAFEPETVKTKSPFEITTISVEDALRELLELGVEA